MSSAQDQRKRKHLRELLEALFADSHNLFVDFIKEDVVRGDVIVRNLPSLHCGWTGYVSAAVDGFSAQSVVERDFFAKLAARQPCQIMSILRCAIDFEIDAPALEGIVDGVETQLATVPMILSDALLLVKDIYPLHGIDVDEPRRRLTLRINRLNAKNAVDSPFAALTRGGRDVSVLRPPPGASAHHDDIVKAIEFNQIDRAKRKLLSFIRNRLGIVAAVSVVSDLRRRERGEWPEYILARSISALAAPEPPRARPLPLICTGIRKRFRRARIDFQLDCAQLMVPPRTVMGLVGLNGTGKSTLLRILAGRIAADTGEIQYPDGSCSAASCVEDVDWREIQRKVFYLSQHPDPWAGTLEQELHLFAQTQGYRGDMNRLIVELVLDQSEMSSYRKMTLYQLSGGFRVRAALAKMLISRAPLIVLDEPLAPLDVDAQRDVLDYLRESTVYSEEPRCTILSSQHIIEVENIAHQVLLTDKNGSVRPVGGMLGACIEIWAAPGAFSGLFIESIRRFGEVSWIDTQRSCIVVESASCSPEQLARDTLSRLHEHSIHLRSFRDISDSALRRLKERQFYA